MEKITTKVTFRLNDRTAPALERMAFCTGKTKNKIVNELITQRYEEFLHFDDIGRPPIQSGKLKEPYEMPAEMIDNFIQHDRLKHDPISGVFVLEAWARIAQAYEYALKVCPEADKDRITDSYNSFVEMVCSLRA